MTLERFSGATVLVTGASSGIGRACAERFATEGARVVLCGRNADRLGEAAASLPGGSHLILPFDVLDEDATKTAIRESSRERPFRAIVHAAGIHALRPLQIESGKTLAAMLATNVGGAFAVVRAALGPGVLTEGSSIVIISSQAATRGTGAASAYAASKGALEAAGRSWAVEFSRRKVRVNMISPGVVKTAMTDRMFAALGQQQREAIETRHLLGLGEPQDVAAAAAYLASDEAKWLTGATLAVDGGYSAW